MIYRVLVLALLFVSFALQEGMVISNESLKDSSKNILIRNIKNKIVLTENPGFKNVRVVAKYSKVLRDSAPNVFYIEPIASLRVDTLRVYCGEDYLLKKVAFKVETYKNPPVLLNGLNNTQIGSGYSADTLANKHQLTINNSSDDLRGCKWVIKSYEIVITAKGTVWSFANNNTPWEAHTIELIKKAKGGSFTISNLKIASANCGEMRIAPFAFKLK